MTDGYLFFRIGRTSFVFPLSFFFFSILFIFFTSIYVIQRWKQMSTQTTTTTTAAATTTTTTTSSLVFIFIPRKFKIIKSATSFSPCHLDRIICMPFKWNLSKLVLCPHLISSFEIIPNKLFKMYCVRIKGSEVIYQVNIFTISRNSLRPK